jgi:hypothetical protein
MYAGALGTSPKRPCVPPHSSDGIEDSFALSFLWMMLITAYVGVPVWQAMFG